MKACKVGLLAVLGMVVFCSYAQALFIGSGISNITAGRLVPGLNGTIGTNNFLVSGFATGVKSDVHYHSGYQLGLLWRAYNGKIVGRPLRLFIGPGFHYAKRGLSNVGDTQITEQSDFAWGLSVRNEFKLLGPITFYSEVLLGIEGLALIFNNFRTVAQFGIGVSL